MTSKLLAKVKKAIRDIVFHELYELVTTVLKTLAIVQTPHFVRYFYFFLNKVNCKFKKAII